MNCFSLLSISTVTTIPFYNRYFFKDIKLGMKELILEPCSWVCLKISLIALEFIQFFAFVICIAIRYFAHNISRNIDEYVWNLYDKTNFFSRDFQICIPIHAEHEILNRKIPFGFLRIFTLLFDYLTDTDWLL